MVPASRRRQLQSGTTATLMPSPEATNSIASVARDRGKVWVISDAVSMAPLSISRTARAKLSRPELDAPTTVISR